MNSMTRSVLLILAIALIGGVAAAATRPVPGAERLQVLPPVSAVGIRFDTLLVGGYAAGSFTDAVRELGGDLTVEERLLVGRHLDRIFADAIPDLGLGRTGRLRVAYERAARADGSTKSIRVLSAEVAVSGRLYTAYYFERDGRPGYFDNFGRPLDATGMQGPLETLHVNSPFGSRRLHPILDRYLPHTGVDLAAPRGEPVRATADGIVTAAGESGGYGNLVELRHPNGYSTRYAHLSRIEAGISPSGIVKQGDFIGYVGMTGLATGPHLHYEVRRRGQPMDPMRIAGSVDWATDLFGEENWPRERRQLGALLARAPTIRQAETSGS